MFILAELVAPAVIIMAKMTIIDIDITCNVAFTDKGHILEIETYVDEEDTPCLPEEAVAAYVMIGTNRFERFDLAGEE